MGQVMSVVDRLAGNPNSKLDAGNVVDVIGQIFNAVTAGYQRVATLEASTSLTAAEAPATAASVPATPATAETPIAIEVSPVEARTETVRAAPITVSATPRAQKAAAKKTAAVAVKSAPTAKTPEPAPAETKAPEVKADAPATAKATTKNKAGKATDKVAVKPSPAPEPLTEVVAVEDKDITIVESMIREHGSARAAAAVVDQNRTRGRKTAWQKIIEERADQELRDAAKTSKKVDAKGLADAIAGRNPKEVTEAEASRAYSLETTGYPFSHIERKPFMDPEKALGAKITCLIDGEQRTMMSRYIDAKYAMKPDEYIAHFALRPDYPMTADIYKKEKRRLAAVQELGKGKRTVEEAPPVQQPTPATTNRRSRKRAA
jgi:predicted transcriptional regulator